MLRYIFLITFLFACTATMCQNSDTILQENEAESILTASVKVTSLHIDLENNDEVELLLKKIHTYKYLESIELEGEVEEATFKKIIYRISSLKNLNSIILKDNFLQKPPDNLNLLKTLRSITVIGNKDMNYNDFFSKISQLNIILLDLTDNDFKKEPAGISTIKSLKRVKVSGSDQLDYEQLMDELAKLPGLTELAIPVNFITEVPKNIVKLKSLKLLDVSDNVLTEIPEDVSALKSINNLSIQGNLFLNPVKELGKFKGADIRVISMDKEISGEDIEELKKIFPNAEINFPVADDEDDYQEPGPILNPENADPFKFRDNGTLKVKKDFKILSDAYLSYQPIFQNIVYNFDTLGFNERYANLNYTNVYRRLPTNNVIGGTIYLSMHYLNFNKKEKKQFSIFQYADFIRFYPELTAFGGMTWIYQGELNKRKLRKKIIKKRWSDIRIIYDSNNSIFTIQLKSPEGFETIQAYPVPNKYNHKYLDQVQKTYPRRFSNYQKALTRRAERFDKELKKNKKKYNADYIKVQDYAWRELQSRMSNTEKLMSKEQWLEYYDNIIANEKDALDKSALSPVYIVRSLTIRGYNNFPRNPVNGYQPKTAQVNFTDKNSGAVLPVANIIVVDNKNKTYSMRGGSLGIAPEPIALKQFSSSVIFVELRNGNIGIVNSTDIDKLIVSGDQVVSLTTTVFNKNLDEIGTCFKEAAIQ